MRAVRWSSRCPVLQGRDAGWRRRSERVARLVEDAAASRPHLLVSMSAVLPERTQIITGFCVPAAGHEPRDHLARELQDPATS